MMNKILVAYLVADGLFVIMGSLLVGFSVIVQNTMVDNFTDGEMAARSLIYQKFPLSAGIVNAIFVFITFAATIPGIVMPTRTWLKISGYMVTICGVYSLVIGLYLWILTLKTKQDFFDIWISQPAPIQDLLQSSFQCCGYFNSTSPAFVTDPTCPSPAAAAMMKGCASPITAFLNIFVDDIFTAVFGMVGIDAVLVLATACLLKDRKERQRYRYIDEKTGSRSTF